LGGISTTFFESKTVVVIFQKKSQIFEQFDQFNDSEKEKKEINTRNLHPLKRDLQAIAACFNKVMLCTELFNRKR
jgi:hypothetical protein